MAGPYTGRWLRLTPPPGLNPNLGSGPSPQHLTPVEPDPAFPEPTPALPPTPAYLYAADDFMLPVPMMVRDPIDREPQTHNVGGADRGEDWIASQQYAAHAHEQDYGAAAVHHFDPPIMRADKDVYHTQRIEAERAVSMSRAALTRGRNALPENNPDGPPDQGHYVMRWIDRSPARHGIRTDQQPIRPYRAQVAADAPKPAADQANQLTSPWRRLSNARQRKLTTPQIRRLPRTPDEFAETDGTEDPQYSQPAYWEW